jgi:hypothetical protein
MRLVRLGFAAACALVALAACSGPKGSDCLSGSTRCGDVCVVLSEDNLNCGACGNACGAGHACLEGACALTCQPSLTSCSGACRDLLNDRESCGACGVACTDGEVCSGGACGLSCQSSLTNCSGTCRDLQEDPDNCGACGNICASQACSAGTCATLLCPIGLMACGAKCRDLQVDTSNCGACGTACAAGQICDAGACVTGSLTLFDSITGTLYGVSNNNLDPGRGCGAQITVSVNRTLRGLAVYNYLLTAGVGHVKWLVFDHTNHATPLYVAPEGTFNPETSLSWKWSPLFELPLLAGHTYDIGGVADVWANWPYDHLTTETAGGIATTGQTPIFEDYAAPYVLHNGGGAADCGIRFYFR